MVEGRDSEIKPKGKPEQENSSAHFDSHTLLKELDNKAALASASTKPTESPQAPKLELKKTTESGQLEMTNAFTGRETADTRAVKAKAPEKAGAGKDHAEKLIGDAKTHDAPAKLVGDAKTPDPPAKSVGDGKSKETPKPGDHVKPDDASAKPGESATQTPPSDASPITIVGKSKEDPAKPTVLFLDDFTSKSREQFDTAIGGAPHGEISAASAEANGFNVVKAQSNSGNFADEFREIEKRINSGELHLGKGDAINISMGRSDLTFEQVSKFTGINLTPENLAENKDKLLDKLHDMSQTGDNQELRKVLSDVVESNQIIKRLQDEKGITVVHSAGNDGPDKFSLEFMNAKVQLGSKNPETGKFDSFSANHSLMDKGPQNGVLAVTAGFNPLSKTPLASDRGDAIVQIPGGNAVRFPIQGFYKSAISTNAYAFDRSKITFDDHGAKLPAAEAPPLPAGLFRPTPESNLQTRFQVGPAKPAFNTGALHSPETTSLVPFNKTLKVHTNNEQGSGNTDSAMRVAGSASGSSFSNATWFVAHHDELAAIKRAEK